MFSEDAMPRKPWVKLSTSIIASTTWRATRSKGIREFFALLVLADENGLVDRVNVEQLPLTVYCTLDAKARTKCRRSLDLLQSIGSILQNDDGTILLPKYREYQYMQGFRSDIVKAEVGQLPRHRAEQSRAEQSRADKELAIEVVEEQVKQLYALYPRKAGKAQAFKAIRAALGKISFDELFAVVAEYADSPKVKATPQKFIPYPATWFNGERWLDDRSAWHDNPDAAPSAIGDFFIAAHANRHHSGRYRLTGRDSDAIKQLEAIYPEGLCHELESKIREYLIDQDPQINRLGWPLWAFPDRLNKYAASYVEAIDANDLLPGEQP